jgi:hypothetical protein
LKDDSRASDGYRTVKRTDPMSNNSGFISTNKSFSKATPHANFQHFMHNKNSKIKGTHSKMSIVSGYSRAHTSLQDQGNYYTSD